MRALTRRSSLILICLCALTTAAYPQSSDQESAHTPRFLYQVRAWDEKSREYRIGFIDSTGKLVIGFDRPFVMIAENDQKADGSWPGREGAEKVGRAIADAFPELKVYLAFPPECYKDVRELFTGYHEWASVERVGEAFAQYLGDSAM